MNLKTVQFTHETLAYREQGEGENTLILIHGNMTSSKHFDLLMDNLPNSIKVYAIDMRGFGASTYNNKINRLKDFSDDLKILVDYLGISKFSIAGWSTGGGVAMQYCIDHANDVDKLILIESVGISGYPIFKKDEEGKPILTEPIKTRKEIESDIFQFVPVINAYKNKDKDTLRALWNMVIYTNNKPTDNRYNEYLDDMLTQRNYVDVNYSLIHFNISNKNNGVVDGTNEIEKITQDTLIYQGINDLVIPVTTGEEIKESLINAKKVDYVLHDGGHSPFIDNIKAITKTILNFLDY